MSCNASGKSFDLATLTVIRGEEFLAERIVSANKLSVTKFVCPEAGCGKSVDVYYMKDGSVKVRHHSARGERISMVGGTARATVGKAVTLTSIVELQKKQAEIFAAQMAQAVERAEDLVKSADAKIEAQLALIKQSEARIEEIKRDRLLAEEILTNPDLAQYRKAV